MAFAFLAPHIIGSDLGYQVERADYPTIRYVEGDRCWVLQYEFLGSGNAFLDIPGDGLTRMAFYPDTLRTEPPGLPFSPDERARTMRRILAAYAWEGVITKVVTRDGAEPEAYVPGED